MMGERMEAGEVVTIIIKDELWGRGARGEEGQLKVDMNENRNY